MLVILPIYGILLHTSKVVFCGLTSEQGNYTEWSNGTDMDYTNGTVMDYTNGTVMDYTNGTDMDTEDYNVTHMETYQGYSNVTSTLARIL